MQWKGWSELDVLLINGDAYVDHPTFGIPCLGRWLTKLGLRVGIVSQPRWDSTEDFTQMGRPRLFVGVSSGTVDSMINNYTANKKLAQMISTPKGAKAASARTTQVSCTLSSRRKLFLRLQSSLAASKQVFVVWPTTTTGRTKFVLRF